MHHSPGSDTEVLVKVDNLGKIFCRDFKKSLSYGLQDSLRDLIGGSRKAAASDVRELRKGEFWANKGISFELRRGECLGLIGHNGAGKTTLLKMLNGLIKPDTGRIEMHGRIGALIALGAGFNPILSGRENIYINGSIIGLSKKEIDAKIDEIIEFAEIAEFIDSPVQTYSSGMQVRLGFSIASSIKPDILLLDEVLAVGDVGFVVKCLNRIRDLSKDCAIIFVSHSMEWISRFCTRVLVMDRGVPILDARNPADGINCYFEQMSFEGSETGTGQAELEQFEVRCNGNILKDINPVIQQGSQIEIGLAFKIQTNNDQVRLQLSINDEAQSQVVSFPIIDEAGEPIYFGEGHHHIDIGLGSLELNSGTYNFMLVVHGAESKMNHFRKSGIAPFRVKADSMAWAKIVRPAMVKRVSG